MSNNNLSWSQNRKAVYSGFTLIEAVLALVVLASVCFLFMPLIRISTTVSRNLTNSHQLELHTFLIQLQRSLDQGEFVKVEENRLFLREKDPAIKWLTEVSQYRQMIRRQKNQGHEPLLMNVSTATFTAEKGRIAVEVSFLNGEDYRNYLFYREERRGADFGKEMQ